MCTTIQSVNFKHTLDKNWDIIVYKRKIIDYSVQVFQQKSAQHFLEQWARLSHISGLEAM